MKTIQLLFIFSVAWNSFACSKEEQKVKQKKDLDTELGYQRTVAENENFIVKEYFDAPSETGYFLTRIKHKDKAGNIIKLRQSRTNDLDAGETVRAFANRVGAVLAFNGSTQCPTAEVVMMPCAVSIIDGEVIRDNPSSSRYTLGIKENNELVVFPLSTNATAMLTAGATDALTAFVPLIDDHMAVPQEVLDKAENSNEAHPRQVIAQLDNMDLIFLSCGGRGYGGVGMTARQVIRILHKHKVDKAFMLDGGGSVSTVVNGELVTPLIDGDGTAERPRPSFLYVMP